MGIFGDALGCVGPGRPAAGMPVGARGPYGEGATATRCPRGRPLYRVVRAQPRPREDGASPSGVGLSAQYLRVCLVHGAEIFGVTSPLRCPSNVK